MAKERMSFICRHSFLLAALCRIPSGAMPAKIYRRFEGVGLRQSVNRHQLALRMGSSLFAWVDCSHTEQAYLDAE